MELIIYKSQRRLSRDTLESLLNDIKNYIGASIDDSKLSIWDYYLKTMNINVLDKEKVSAKQIIIHGIRSLSCTIKDNSYVIALDFNKFSIKNIAKLYDVCELIDRGNLQMRGYPIFTNAFNYFDKLLKGNSFGGA